MKRTQHRHRRSSSCCCASCGIEECDDIKLKKCTACDLVRYCGDDKSEHEDACKKRAAELRDELLFKQPKSTYLGDCPICCLPMPLDILKSMIMVCCSKIICIGCDHANTKRQKEMRLKTSCPFCRKLKPKTIEEQGKQNMERIEANDPNAMNWEGVEQHIKGNHTTAFEYWTKAAKLGHAGAHFGLAILYETGRGVEKDNGKAAHHAEAAAIAGQPEARHVLGCEEYHNDNAGRAVKHFIIAAKQGYDRSIGALMEMCKGGFASKEDLAAALRAHQAAVDATKSPQREAVEVVRTGAQ